MSPGVLDDILCGLKPVKNPSVLVGLDPPDDCAVYKLDNSTAIVQTVDFFTPVVDDPYAFGQIAAANSLSDIYSMGAQPVFALNLVGFPSERLDREILREIMRGGMEKMAEAGVSVAGGHSIDDVDIKYGFAVTGLVHPDRVLTKQGARVGDAVVITKSLGTGIISTALKAGMADASDVAAITRIMESLNKTASEIICTVGVHACTDITGFGLIGHSLEVARASNKAICLNAARIPVLNNALEYAARGLVPGGAHNNREFYESRVEYKKDIPPELRDLLYDPQTSGGLLITVAVQKHKDLMQKFSEKGLTAVTVGEVLEGPAGHIYVTT